MSRIVMVTGTGGAQFAAIERPDGMLVFASDYVTREAGGIGTVLPDGTRVWFLRKADFAAELAEAGLQPIWTPPAPGY